MRIRGNVNNDTPLPPETPAGENPPDGAMIDYYLSAPATGEIALEVRDSRGTLIRRFSSEDKPPVEDREAPFASFWLEPHQPLSKEAGMHRWIWDLRVTSPAGLERSYPMAAISGRTATVPRGPLVVPGVYQIALITGGQTIRQPLTLATDPRVKSSEADLAKQFSLGLKIRDALDRSASRSGPTPRRIRAALAALAGVVDSADRAPTSQAEAAYAQAVRELDAAVPEPRQ